MSGEKLSKGSAKYCNMTHDHKQKQMKAVIKHIITSLVTMWLWSARRAGRLYAWQKNNKMDSGRI